MNALGGIQVYRLCRYLYVDIEATNPGPDIEYHRNYILIPWHYCSACITNYATENLFEIFSQGSTVIPKSFE